MDRALKRVNKNGKDFFSSFSFGSYRSLHLVMGLFFSILPNPSAASEQGATLDIRWMGTDLIDEMIHDWELQPPFSTKELVSLAEIESPMGLDERFSIEIENHLVELLLKLTATHVQLARCSACLKMVAKSTKAGTYIGRGIDQPELLKELASSSGSKKGLSLSFEAEGKSLVLRAQLFSFTEVGQPILWAKSYATSMSSRLALQNDERLVSLKEARAVQEAMLNRVDPLEFVTRLTVRNFKIANEEKAGAQNLPPLLFLEQSVEGVLLPKRDYRAALTLGTTSVEKSMAGYSFGGHIAKLVNRVSPSLANPDLYFFSGFEYFRLRGPGAALFGAKELDVAKLLGDRKEPRASFVSYRLGLELHMKHRFGMLVFMEKIPTFDKSEIIGSFNVLGMSFQNYGIGMAIKW